MTQQFLYRSPTTPGNPGWVVDLGTEAVRLGSIQGLPQEAELGAVGIGSIVIDDPTGTVGHSGDAIIGLKQFTWNELSAPSDRNTIWEGYIGDRHYRRGTPNQSSSLVTGPARVIDVTLVDINSFLSFRLFHGSNTATSFSRPAETDVQRVTALLAVAFLSDTLFDYGLVATGSPVNMDAVDYDGQRPADVLNDCAQQSGKNYFVYQDEGSPGYGLFYDFNGSMVYLSSLQISNVLADVDNATTFAPMTDADLFRDPSRVISGAYIQNGSNSVYGSNLATSYIYGYRDALANSVNVTTVASAASRISRYLSDNSTEDDRITFTVKLPAPNVNDWRAGQGAQVKFSHLPGYESFRYVRALTRSVAADEQTSDFYNIRYEVTPMEDVQACLVNHPITGTLVATAPQVWLALAMAGTSTPTVFSSGIGDVGTGDITPLLPSGSMADDIFLCIAQTSNEGLDVPAGWARVDLMPISQGVVGGAASVAIDAFWRRATGSDTDPTLHLSTPGNHIAGQIFGIRGCVTSGNPWSDADVGFATGTAAVSIPVSFGPETSGDLLFLALNTALPGSGSITGISSWDENASCGTFENSGDLAFSGSDYGRSGSVDEFSGPLP